MKHTKPTSTALCVLLGFCLVALTTTARADAEYVYFHDDVYRTVIWASVILAAGMIISALILKKPNKPDQ